jgi:hypothetical protein
MIYPERRMVSPNWIIGQAQDHLATEYMRANPGANQCSGEIEANAKVHGIEEAMEVLSDAGVCTFAK